MVNCLADYNINFVQFCNSEIMPELTKYQPHKNYVPLE